MRENTPLKIKNNVLLLLNCNIFRYQFNVQDEDASSNMLLKEMKG